ncbi:MAG: hypothetical protein KGI99_19875 [Bradyrhizobium sp.]|uniref:hypothetical protein n=1 Tax=Bradyrhizobium sp. TaxID=376 RepID=UPI001C2A1778|nr:hypothetical protein [Bradyrhizobium sp.]MBU6464514.1 hypothetical protein [Pseudomonadota bacterium]MDE2069388.1 hypothetical protein [Bradyrhizobium sp.]
MAQAQRHAWKKLYASAFSVPMESERARDSCFDAFYANPYPLRWKNAPDPHNKKGRREAGLSRISA